MTELTIQDLDGQQVELLPARETLYSFGDTFSLNLAAVDAANTSAALNVASLWSNAHSIALQSVHVSQ
jgi:hypothetical protein